MRLQNRTLTVSAAAGLLVAAAAYAQTPPRTPPPPRPGAQASATVAAARLNLTKEQRGQLRALREAQQPEVRALRERMRVERRKLRDAMRADVPDEQAVREAAAAVAAVQADQLALMARARGRMLEVLTPEQQARLKEARARAAERIPRARRQMLRRGALRRWRG